MFESLHRDITATVTLVRSGLRLIRDYSPMQISVIGDRFECVDDIHEVIQFSDRMDNDCVVAQEYVLIMTIIPFSGERPPY